MFLASKSNYQHILDGTLLPGVSYPENLAENLSSKRTNHKLAEQGRRNRINNALKVIEALLPPGFAAARSPKEPEIKGAERDKEKSGNSMVSKASTVELAIDYIKALKGELDDVKKKLNDAETKLGHDNTSKSPSCDSPEQDENLAATDGGEDRNNGAAAGDDDRTAQTNPPT